MRTNKAKVSTPVFTHNGARASKISPEQELARSVMSCMLFEGTFYENGMSISDRIDQLSALVNEDTVSELAVKARGEGNLRHVPLRLALSLIRRHSKLAASTITKVIHRPDEMAELISQYWAGKKTPLSYALKKGLRDAFVKFDKYQLGKYQMTNRDITLRDVMFMVHPDPTKSELPYEKKRQLPGVYKKLASNELEAPETWEKQSSSGKDQKEVFTSLINENKLGAMAMLRNLRLMQGAGVSDTVIRKGLTQMNAERVLPFRFITAAKFAPNFEPELEEAMYKNLTQEEKLAGNTILLVDNSGSMSGNISDKSEITRADAACGLAIMARELCQNVKVISFSDRVTAVPNRRGFALAEAIRKTPIGGTNLGLAINHANSIGYDRLIVFTDEQTTDKVGSPTGRAYIINVAPYQHGVGYGEYVHIDGFSEATIKFITAYERELLND